MNSADYAAMSDPEMNRFFRRRWIEPEAPPQRANEDARRPRAPTDPVEITGLALLDEWRKSRGGAGK